MGKQEGTVRGLQFRAIAALRRDLGIEPGRRRGPGPGLGDGPVNEDPMQALEPRAGDELERPIERYATRPAGSEPGAGAARPRGRHGGGLAPALAPERAEAAARRPAATPGVRGGAGRSRLGRAAPGASFAAAMLAGPDGRILGVRRVAGRRAPVRAAPVARGAHAAQRTLDPPRCRACARPDAGSPRSPRRPRAGDDGAVDAAVRCLCVDPHRPRRGDRHVGRPRS